MATRTISTKLAIEGESEYRSALQRVNSELKSLQSNLKLVESQYQNSQNSIAALQAKHDALSAVIDAQKRKVAELKEALGNAKSAQDTYAQRCAELREKIQANAEAMEKLKTASGDTGKEQAALAAETEKLKKELADEEAKLAAAERGVNSWQTQLNSAQIKLNDLDAELQKNDKYLDEAKESADGCAKSIDEYGREVKESAESTEKQNDALEALAAALAAAGVTAGIKAITDALKECVAASADFEKGMSAVGAIASATGGEMEELAAKAKEIGASTKFTAGEAAEAMEYMALAGWSSKEMLAGVDGVIQLAAASGENLATVSDIVTDALTAFGLKAEDSGHFVDVLAKTAASSNTTVTMLGEAFKYAAPLAGALGYSVEDVAVAMGLMANQGIKGSQAGTAMRTLFTKLTSDITLTGKAFGEVTVYASNADGSMKPLSQTLQDLRVYFDQMTQAEKLQNAETIAGKYAMSGLTALMNTTEDDFQSLTRTIQDCTGAAKDMADVRMDNLAGQVTLMESAADALKIAIGDDLNPALRGLAETGTDVLTWAAEFVEEHEAIVPVIAAVTAGLTTLSATIVGFGAVKAITPLVTAFNAALAASPAGLVATAVITLTAALVTLDALLPSTASEYDTLTASSQNQYDKLTALNAEYEKACDLYGKNSEQAQALASQIEAETELYEHSKTTIGQLHEKTEALLNTNKQIRETYAQTNSAIDTQEQSCGYLLEKLQSLMSIEEKSAGTKQQILAVVELLNEQVPELSLSYDEYNDKLNLTADSIQAVIDKELERERMETAYAEMKDRTRNQLELEQQMQSITEERAASTERLETAEARLNETMEAGANDGFDWLNRIELINDYEAKLAAADERLPQLEADEKAVTEAMAENNAEIEQLKENYDSFAESTDTANNGIDAGAEAARLLSEQLETLASDYKEAYESAKESLDGQFGLWEEVGTLADKNAKEISEAYEKAWDDAYQAAEKSVQGQFGLFEEAEAVTAKSAEDMIRSMESQETYWTNYMANVDAALNSGVDGVEEWAAQFMDGSKSSAEALAGFVSATDVDKERIIASYQELRDKQTEVTESLAEMTAQGREEFEGLAEASQISAQSIIEAQESQQAYWQEYTDNMNTLLSRNVEGVENLAKSYSDGSTESAEALAVLANATDEELEQIIQSMNRTDEMRSSIAGTAADLQTQFSERLAQMVTDFEGMVNAMSEKSGEVDFSAFLSEVQTQFASAGVDIYAVTQEAGENADLGFQNGLAAGSGEVYTAASAVGQSVIDALKEVLKSHSPSEVTDGIGQDTDEGLAQGIEAKKERVKSAAAEVGTALSEQMTENGRQSVESFDAEYAALEQRTRERLNLVRSVIAEYGNILPGEMRTVGEQSIDGMTEGMYNRSGSLYSAVWDIVSTAIETARQAADTHSPSKKTEKIFEDVGEGMVVGVEKKKQRVAEATQGVVDKALRIDTSGMIAAIKMLDARKPDTTSMLYPTTPNSPNTRGGNINVSVTMPGMVVREEADIHKISQALAKEIAFAVRQKGG